MATKKSQAAPTPPPAAHADASTQVMPIEQFAEPAYLAYAMHAVKDRAIPDVEDGLKPVQRRVLWAMLGLKLLPQNAKPIKSARIVGDVIGKYHPHGDQSVYDAMVRMAQPFMLRYPLVHGEGNFGSRDGDSPAAMRYTEARLAPVAAALLDEMSWDTVQMRFNYDQTCDEPETLPSKLPFGLLNGASGIAVGMATEIPSHNLREAAAAAKLILTAKKRPSLTDVMALMPAPDFATGAQIISSPEEIAKAYETGRGPIRTRATWEFITAANGKDWKLVVTSLPPGVSPAKIMIRINDLMEPKPPEKDGKKQPLTPEQLRLKKLFGDLIDDVRNVADKAHPVRIQIEPKNRSVDQAALTRALCAYTDMEINVPMNMVCVDLSGSPKQAGVVEWLAQWCDYRVITVRRRTEDEKNRIDKRIHILEGRLIVLDRLDEAIAIIRQSEDPKADLMAAFALTEIQAEDVLDMRLRSLSRLDGEGLVKELADKRAESKRLGALLASDAALRKLIVSEIDQVAKEFGDDRRTLLVPDASSARASDDAVVAEILAPEPVAVVLTERGWLGWRPAKSLEEARALDYKIKAGDQIKQVLFGDRAHHLLLLSNSGRAYSLRLTELPSRADAATVAQFFKPDASEQFVTAAIVQPTDRLLVASSGGYGFVVQASDALNRMSAGKAFLTVDSAAGETPLPLLPLSGSGDEELTGDLLAVSSDGRGVCYPLAEVKRLPKGKGVALIGLGAGARLSDLMVLDGTSAPVLVLPNGKTAPVSAEVVDAVRGGRSAGRKGNMLHKNAAAAVFVRPGREGALPPAG